MIKKIKKMHKSATSLHKRNIKRVKRHYDRRPLITVLSVVVLVTLLGFGVYQTPKVLNQYIGGTDKNTSSETKSDNLEDATPIASVSPSPSATPAASDEPTAEEIDKKGVGMVINPTPNCRGVGCPTANPKFSIITPKSITVTAGNSVGPFTASTSDGSSVHWSGPTYTQGFGPYSYGFETKVVNAHSFQYYVRAEANIAPGTYVCVMSVIQPSTETIVKTTVNITVLPYAPDPMVNGPPSQ